jgi:hypothetical protein
MALYNVTIEPAIHLQASFYVHYIVCLPGAQVGFVKRFRNSGYSMRVVLYLFHGEANAVVAHTLVYFQFLR